MQPKEPSAGGTLVANMHNSNSDGLSFSWNGSNCLWSGFRASGKVQGVLLSRRHESVLGQTAAAKAALTAIIYVNHRTKTYAALQDADDGAGAGPVLAGAPPEDDMLLLKDPNALWSSMHEIGQ